MKRTLFAVLTLVLATAVFAQKDTSTLVEASKDAKSKRKKSSTKVITNADVKKSKGKIGETKGKATPVEQLPTLAERHAAQTKVRKEAEARLTAAEKAVADLEAELMQLEQSYYAENDLNRRDIEIVPRFNDVKRRLDEARKELEAAAPAPPAPPSP
jgi:hypothetical protein